MGNNTSTFIPSILYGVLEKSENKVLSTPFLKKHNLYRLPTFINNTNGYNFVYGVKIILSDINKDVFEGKEYIENFINYMKNEYDIMYETPDIHICIEGNYKLDSIMHSYQFDDAIEISSESESDLEERSEESELDIIDKKIIDKENIENTSYTFW